MIGKRNAWAALTTVLIIFSGFVVDAYAECRYVENVQLELPFNVTDLSASDRRVIADAVKRSRSWPGGLPVRAFIAAGAYIGERDLDVLQDRRGENVQAYLRELGIKRENIYITPTTMTDGYVVTRADGELSVRQIEIDLLPICKGQDCSKMCDDPRPK